MTQTEFECLGAIADAIAKWLGPTPSEYARRSAEYPQVLMAEHYIHDTLYADIISGNIEDDFRWYNHRKGELE